jgi:hypothetical protein
VASENDFPTGVQNADIILCNKDIAFENRFINKESNMSAYNGICVNYLSLNIWRHITEYYNLKDTLTQNAVNSMMILSGTEVQSINSVLVYLLKNCYVWIKCSFFADYIDYRDFDQSLNKTATVIHENLMLTKIGDWRRYERLFNDNQEISQKDMAKRKRPYLPSTTPSIDRVKDLILPEHVINSNIKTEIQYIIDDANDPESEIGALPIEPMEKNSDDSENDFTDTSFETPPPIWFDPESRKEGKDYNDFPILIPKNGNLITNGRIISPSIDELWQMIKEMISGRQSDNTALSTEAGYPRGDGQLLNAKDTRPSIKKHIFRNYDTNREVIGDPTIIDYNLDSDEPRYEVKSWVNDPSRIEYKIIKELVDLNTMICNGEDSNIIEESIMTMEPPESYMPSLQPWTLREIEAQLKGIRWNLCYHMTFVHNNMVYNGLLGRANSDNKDYNKANGSVYQLHKDYDAKRTFNNPNTVYDDRANRETVSYGVGVGQITHHMVTNEIDPIPAWAVYMGADGQWHSTKQACVIPIRTDELF